VAEVDIEQKLLVMIHVSALAVRHSANLESSNRIASVLYRICAIELLQFFTSRRYRRDL
jgi:hypothetical protein